MPSEDRLAVGLATPARRSRPPSPTAVAVGSATFSDVAPFGQPSAMVYGADGELLVAVPAGGVDAPGGHLDGGAVVGLRP